jgi:hypothetical protein
MTPTIAVYTHTGLLPANLIQAWVAAAQVAIDRDFAQHWSGATLRYVQPGGAILPDEWQLVFFDHSDQANALGYHDLNAGGMPIMKVFIQDILADRVNWNVTATHEIYETIVDPLVNRTVAVTGADGVTWEYPMEVCDAPEDDRFAVRVAGHLASNAVTPAWFDPDGEPPFTIYPCAEINAPLTLASGGYIGRREVSPVAGEWQQVMARVGGPRQIKGPFSRTIRRFDAT